MLSVDTGNLAALTNNVNSQAKFSAAYYLLMDRVKLLQELIDSRFNGSQAAFARAIKKPPSLVSQWLSKHRGFGDASARHIELELSLGEAYFDGRRNTPMAVVEPTSDTAIAIQMLDVAGSMGYGEAIPDHETVINRMNVEMDWVRKHLPAISSPGNLKVISGYGDSMMPTFNDGDILLVDTGIRAVNIDGVYVLSANERLYIKRVRQRMDGHFEISSDNPTVKTVDVLNGDHEVTVHGRVVWAWNGRKL